MGIPIRISCKEHDCNFTAQGDVTLKRCEIGFQMSGEPATLAGVHHETTGTNHGHWEYSVLNLANGEVKVAEVNSYIAVIRK
jgi:hypothetical protein